MNRKKLAIAVIIVLLLLVIVGLGISKVSNARRSLIPSMSFDEMLRFTTRGNVEAVITVGVIRKGEASFTVYGKDATILPNEEYKYEIGSVTKTFTSSLLCKAIYEGRIALSDHINQYVLLPSKEYYPTFKRLVTHTSGYKSHYFDIQMIFNFLRGEPNDFYGISVEKFNKKIGKIRVKDQDYDFNYSNFGMSVVGSALAEVYDSDYKTVMNQFIKTDLGLLSTSISASSESLSGSWNWKPDDGYLPAGAIISTISDMLKYVQLHLSEELPYLALGHEVLALVGTNLRQKQYEMMGIRIDATGIGWMIDTANKIVWHNGGTTNFNSYVAFDKEKQLGVVILSNLAPDYRIPATLMGSKLMIALQSEC